MSTRQQGKQVAATGNVLVRLSLSANYSAVFFSYNKSTSAAATETISRTVENKCMGS
jgi:hypothetical protein